MSGIATIFAAAMHLAGQFVELMQLAKDAPSLTPDEVKARAEAIMARTFKAEESEWALVASGGRP